MPGWNILSFDEGYRLGTPQLGRYFDAGEKGDLAKIKIRKAADDSDGLGSDGKSSKDATFLDTCIVTSIRYNREVACQPEPTISGDLYINFFGDKPTEYTVEGIIFDRRKCGDNTGQNRHGGGEDPVKSIIDFYDKYRLQLMDDHDTKKQVTLTTYNTMYDAIPVTYVGILIKMHINTSVDPRGNIRYEFSFIFIAIE